MSALRTGKLPANPRDGDLRLADYVDLATILPKVPAQFGHERPVHDWLMLGNGPDTTLPTKWTAARDGAGDCVWAGAGHETLMWTAAHRRQAQITATDAIGWYEKYTGYDPVTGDHDEGTEVRQALGVRAKTGLVDSAKVTHKLAGFVALEPGNHDHLAAAMYLFGAVGIGIQFPGSAMDQFNQGDPWDVVQGAEVDGGHYIPLVARRGGRLDCVTWGRLQPMTVAFFETYCDEAYALLSPESLDRHGKSPEGLNIGQLRRDLKAVA